MARRGGNVYLIICKWPLLFFPLHFAGQQWSLETKVGTSTQSKLTFSLTAANLLNSWATNLMSLPQFLYLQNEDEGLHSHTGFSDWKDPIIYVRVNERVSKWMESLAAFITGFRIPEYLFTRKVLHTDQQGAQDRDKEGRRQAKRTEWGKPRSSHWEKQEFTCLAQSQPC